MAVFESETTATTTTGGGGGCGRNSSKVMLCDDEVTLVNKEVPSEHVSLNPRWVWGFHGWSAM